MKKNKTIRNKLCKGRGRRKSRVKCKTRSKHNNLIRITRKRRNHVGSGLWDDFKSKLRFGSSKVQSDEASNQSDEAPRPPNKDLPPKIKEGWERVTEEKNSKYKNILGIVESCYFSLSLENDLDKPKFIDSCINDAKSVAKEDILIPYRLWESLRNDLNKAILPPLVDSDRIITSQSNIKEGEFYKYIYDKLNPPPIDKTKILKPLKY